MKKGIFICIFCTLILTSCGKKSDTAVSDKSSSSELSTSATTSTTAVTTSEIKSKISVITTTEKTITVKNVDLKEQEDSQSQSEDKNKSGNDSNTANNKVEEKPQNKPSQNLDKPSNNSNSSNHNSVNGNSSNSSSLNAGGANTNESSSGNSTTTTKPPVTTTKPQTTPTKPPSSGLSQSDRNNINQYIKEVAKSYGIGTACKECNNQSAVVLKGDIDIWSKYSFNAPINTKICDTVDSIKSSVNHDIKMMYNEWVRNGETKDDISECMCVYIYWERDIDKYWLYLMW